MTILGLQNIIWSEWYTKFAVYNHLKLGCLITGQTKPEDGSASSTKKQGIISFSDPKVVSAFYNY